MWKKILVITSLMIMVLCTILLVESRPEIEGVDDMYFVEVYDKDGVHLSNIEIEEWSIIRRVFDFDTSTFKGVTHDDISDGLIFVFKNDIGHYQYSGFMKNITQDNGLVTFRGDDFRKVFDTQIIMDYTQLTTYEIELDEEYMSLENVFTRVIGEVETQYNGNIDFINVIPANTQDTSFVGNYAGTSNIVNAWKYLKIYLAHYNYYIEMEYLGLISSVPTVKISIIASTETEEIKLDDFTFDKTTTEVKINNTIAVLRTQETFTNHTFIYSSEELYNATPGALQEIIDVEGVLLPETWKPSNFDDSTEDWNFDYVFKVQLWDGTAYEDTLLRTFYMQNVINWGFTGVIETVRINYYLGKDNQVYIDSIPAAQRIEPTVSKIFNEEYFSASQYLAISELINARYVEYIILNETNIGPIDIRTLSLYELVTIFDSEGTSKVVPVSEIEWTNKGYNVKLGFKKTLFTELVKGGN